MEDGLRASAFMKITSLLSGVPRMIIHQGHHLNLRGIALQLPAENTEVKREGHAWSEMNLLFIDVYLFIVNRFIKAIANVWATGAVPPCPCATVPCTAHKMSEIHTIVLLAIQAIQDFENQYGLQAASETRQTSWNEWTAHDRFWLKRGRTRMTYS